LQAATVRVIGAGLAGLSASVALAAKGVRVELFEAAMQAGGRCRSYHDPVLDMTIDNGNHFILSGNDAAFAYLRTIGSAGRLEGPDEPILDFHDFADGARWRIRPNRGVAPWWLFSDSRRVPGTRAADYLQMLALLKESRGRRIDEVIACRGVLWERLLGPFLLGALNTKPQMASADLAGAVLRRSLARGGDAYRIRIAHPNLSAAFVEPAIAFLDSTGARVRFGERVRSLEASEGRVTALRHGDNRTTIAGAETIVLAVPPWVAAELVPGLTVPDLFSPIVNGHFRFAPPVGAAPMVGVIGGTAQWVFAFGDRLSVTVSAADELVDEDRESLARRFWRDVATVHGLASELPPWQIVKERRATFAAIPRQNSRRPGALTPLSNLFLAGDWTDTGLPATIEGAIGSGAKAADLVLKSHIAA
jgi:squalene-associated FAD-dependent desaturase